MAVVPGRTVGSGNPLVDAGITWCETALGNTWNTILVVGVVLIDTMPVDGGRVISQGVVNSDLDGITPVANNGRSWNLTVDGKRRSWGSLEVPVDARDGEVVLTNGASGWGVEISIRVDVESIAPLVSATGRVAAVFIGTVLVLHWEGCASGHSRPCL